MFKNQKGYTLLELCIVLGISGVIVLSSAHIMNNDVLFKHRYLTKQLNRQDILYRMMNVYQMINQMNEFEINEDTLTLRFKNPDASTDLMFLDGMLYSDGQPYLSCNNFNITQIDSTFLMDISLLLPNDDILNLRLKGGVKNK